MSLIKKLINYLKETKVELRHVNWPSRKTTIRFTFLVIGISLAVSAYLGFFDFIFSRLLDTFVLRV